MPEKMPERVQDAQKVIIYARKKVKMNLEKMPKRMPDCIAKNIRKNARKKMPKRLPEYMTFKCMQERMQN